MEYPQYRKYKNIETYFLIHSEKYFEEVKVIGSKYSVSIVEAVQFPEQLLIQDMLANRDNRWETLSSIEFLENVKYIKESKTKLG